MIPSLRHLPSNQSGMYQPGRAYRLNERLEIAAVLLDFDENGKLHPSKSYKTHVVPFDGSNLEPKSLEVNGIDPFHPLRAAREEREALAHIFTPVKKNPFHPFSCFDTVTLCGLAYGQTVLARSAVAAGMEWDTAEAHSAIYDTRMTAELFCKVVNRWEELHEGLDAPIADGSTLPR